MQSPPSSSFSKPISSQLLRVGGLLLSLDALGWAVSIMAFLLDKAGQSGIALIFLPVAMLVFVFGVPAIFVGVLLVLIGAAIRWLRARGSLVFRISGTFSIGVGILAWVPYLLVPDVHANTNLVWITGLTALLVGVPLPLVGVVLFVIGVIGGASETSSGEKL